MGEAGGKYTSPHYESVTEDRVRRPRMSGRRMSGTSRRFPR